VGVLLLGIAAIVLVLVMAVNVVVVLRLRRRLKVTETGLLYARSAAQEFCRLSGDSHRLLVRVSHVWHSDPDLLAKTISSLTPSQQAGIKQMRQAGLIREHCQSIDDITHEYSDFVGQTPLPKEVGTSGISQRP